MIRLAGPTSPLALMLVAACGGAPNIDAPNTNDQLFQPPARQALAAPQVTPPPKVVPFMQMPVRGVAPGAARVIVTVNGAGNPLGIPVSAIDQTFCGDLPLQLPAHYVLDIRGQADDGTLSDVSVVGFDYDPTVSESEPLFECDGRRLQP